MGKTLDTGRLTNAISTDSSNNVGIGVTPFTNGLSKGLDIAGGAGIFGFNNNLYLSSNAYFSTDWKYKATSGASLIQTGGDGSIQFVNAASGTANANISFAERMRITSGGDIIGSNKLNASTTNNKTSTSHVVEKIYKVFLNIGTTSADICTITNAYVNGSVMIECVYMGQFSNSDQNAPSYKKALVTFRGTFITVQDIDTQLTGGNIGTLNFTHVSSGIIKINLTSVNNGATYLNGICYVKVVGGNNSSSSNVDPLGITLS